MIWARSSMIAEWVALVILTFTKTCLMVGPLALISIQMVIGDSMIRLRASACKMEIVSVLQLTFAHTVFMSVTKHFTLGVNLNNWVKPNLLRAIGELKTIISMDLHKQNSRFLSIQNKSWCVMALHTDSSQATWTLGTTNEATKLMCGHLVKSILEAISSIRIFNY